MEISVGRCLQYEHIGIMWTLGDIFGQHRFHQLFWSEEPIRVPTNVNTVFVTHFDGFIFDSV